MAIRRTSAQTEPGKPEDRLARAKQGKFTQKGRRARIARALRALDEAVVDYGLDSETVRWLAEDKELEDS